MKKLFPMRVAALALAAVIAGPVAAQDKVLNLYSARHYQTDEALYDTFTRKPASASTGSTLTTPACWHG